MARLSSTPSPPRWPRPRQPACFVQRGHQLPWPCTTCSRAEQIADRIAAGWPFWDVMFNTHPVTIETTPTTTRCVTSTSAVWTTCATASLPAGDLARYLQGPGRHVTDLFVRCFLSFLRLTFLDVAANYVWWISTLDIAARVLPLEADSKIVNALLACVTATTLASELASRDAAIAAKAGGTEKSRRAVLQTPCAAVPRNVPVAPT